MAASLKKYVIDLSSYTNYGTAAKKIITDIVENLGLTVIEVLMNTSSTYKVNTYYGSDKKLIIQFYNSIDSLYAYILKKTESGNYVNLGSFLVANFLYGSAYSISYLIYTLGESKIYAQTSFLRYPSTNFFVSSMLNTVDAKEYTIAGSIGTDNISTMGYSHYRMYSLSWYIVNSDNSSALISKLSDASDVLIPSDGKVYLVPVRVTVNDWNLIGLIGGKENWYRAYCNVDGVKSTPDFVPGQPITIGSVSGIGFGNLVYVDK